MPKILAFAGSTRTESYNKKLISIAANAAKLAGAEVTLIDLRDFPMPLYDGDLEDKEGLPKAAKELKHIMKEHAAFMIASPEYNSSITGVLKNTIDWTSRSEPGKPEDCYTHKVAALMSASPGGLGGLRGLVHIRSILGNMGVLVLPDQVAISKAHEAFEIDGKLKNQKQRSSIEALAQTLVSLMNRLS